MKRDIMVELLDWKDSKERKPLVLEGARQCGKTYVLEEFGRNSYEDVAKFNFEENPSLASLFEQDFDPKRILFELGLLHGKTVYPERTLVIFDEIQSCSKALTALKYFCENAREYHIACAGSLLGLAIHGGQSFPVGKVDIKKMYPMSFYEFLEATGETALAEYLRGVKAGIKLSAPVAAKLQTSLRQYYVVGGMPEVVAAWCEDNSIEKVESVQQQILNSYELDMVKHAPAKDYPKLSAIWASVPQQLSKPNSKFIFSQVKKGWRAMDLEDALQWLVGAGLVYKVCRIEKPFFPLSSYADATCFKLYLSDVGLLRRLAKLPAQVVLEASPIYTEFKGAMTENYVLNELVKHVSAAAYYWSSGNKAEVDFVIQAGVNNVPIEVKSEENVKARSLAEYRKKYEPTISVKTSMKPDIREGGVLNVPLYMIGSLNNIAAGNLLTEIE